MGIHFRCSCTAKKYLGEATAKRSELDRHSFSIVQTHPVAFLRRKEVEQHWDCWRKKKRLGLGSAFHQTDQISSTFVQKHSKRELSTRS